MMRKLRHSLNGPRTENKDSCPEFGGQTAPAGIAAREIGERRRFRVLERCAGANQIDSGLFLPLRDFFLSYKTPAEQVEEEMRVRPPSSLRDEVFADYKGAAWEVYVQLTLARFEELHGEALRLTNSRGGMLPGGHIMLECGRGSIVIIDPKLEKFNELTEIDALGEAPFLWRCPVLFEIKSSDPTTWKSRYIFRKELKKTEFVSRMYWAKPYVCYIGPSKNPKLQADEKIPLRRYLSIPNNEEITELAERLWLEKKKDEPGSQLIIEV